MLTVRSVDVRKIFSHVIAHVFMNYFIVVVVLTVHVCSFQAIEKMNA